MNDFELVANRLIAISKGIAALNQQKTEFAKSIHYQIVPFFQQLGHVITNAERTYL
jgi:hypothetical protein